MAFNQAYGTLQGTDREMSYNIAYGTAHNMSCNQAYNTTTSFALENKDVLDSSHGYDYESMDALHKMGPPPPYTMMVEGENPRSSGIYETIPGENPFHDN